MSRAEITPKGRQKMRKNPFHSIKFKFFAAISAVALVFITGISCLNLFFYDDYYLSTREHALTEIYRELSAAYTGDIAAVLDPLLRIENTDGVRLSVLSSDGVVKYDSVFRQTSDGDKPQSLVWSWTLALTALREADPARVAQGPVFVTVGTDQRRDPYLCLVGAMADDYLIARIPLAYMEQNSAFNSTFLLLSGLVTLLVCLLLGAVLATHFSRPLIEIGGVAEAMAGLDFSKKYEGRADDEIGQLGQSINALSDHLEEAISDLRATNAQLGREIEEKERVDAMRREFIVNVSHELKTPIALIQGYAEGLQAGVAETPEDRQYYCDTIADEAARMNTMVSQLLSLSKLELGRETVTLTPVDVGEILRAAVEKTAVLRAGRGLTVTCGGAGVQTVTDARLLEQVVMNYLTNAIRYTPDGGRIELTAARDADGGVTLSVYNEGEGVAPEELDKLWEKFYRTDKARSRASGGTGVGLSIVRASAAALGGACSAENVPGGIVFHFRLPPPAPDQITD